MKAVWEKEILSTVPANGGLGSGLVAGPGPELPFASDLLPAGGTHGAAVA